MQYHYVVYYDAEEKKWNVESDTTAYFREGNVWSNDRSFFVPDQDSYEEAFDMGLLNTLHYIVDVFPIPQEVS
jgi:hypothetical protein